MPGNTKCTMRDVARLAGVSTSTVSAVINASVPVSAERIARVHRAMAALDYAPDAIAKSLKTGKSCAIGILVPDITNTFFPEVVRGAEEAAQSAGYSVLLCDSREDNSIEAKHLSALFARRVDGVILACCVNSRAHEIISRRNIPAVFIDRLPQTALANTVCTDNVGAGQLAAKHLIDLGHKRISMLAGNLCMSPHHDRLEGFRKAMQGAHLPILDEYLISGGVQVHDGCQASLELLGLPTRPTAIIASNNKLLLGALQAIEKKHLKIPTDISVLGFDDFLWHNHFSPPLTAIAQPTQQIGQRSFELLHQSIREVASGKGGPVHMSIPAEIRVRNSTQALL